MIKFIYSKPLSICMISLTLLVFGIISLNYLPISYLPDSEEKIISIVTRYHGVSSDQIEKTVTIPLENALTSIPNIKDIKSSSEEGKSTIIIYFEKNVNLKYAIINIIEAVDPVSSSFPKACYKPVIAKNDPDEMPIFIFSMNSNHISTDDIREYAEKELKKDLVKIDGIADIEFSGGNIREIKVDVDKELLINANLSITDISGVINKNYFIMSAGNIYENNNKTTLFSDSRFKNISEINNLLIKKDDKTGKNIYLKDVAEAYETTKEYDSISRFNGKDCVNVYIKKNSDANTLKLCKDLKLFFKNYNNKNIDISYVFDQSKHIENAINNVAFAALIGGILALLILFIFMNDIIPIILITISLPFSIILTFFLMFIFKIEINVMSLAGIALGIGMLLDNSILMTDSLSNDIKNKTWHESNRIIVPILTSTATTIGVFISFLYLSDDLKSLYGVFAVTLIFSLLSSIVSSFLVIPGGHSLLTKLNFKRIFIKQNFYMIIEKISFKFIKWIWRRNKYLKISIVFIVFIGLFCFLLLEKEMFASSSGNEITAYVELDSGTSLEKTSEIVKNIENTFLSVNGIEQISSRIQKWHADIDLKFDYKYFNDKNDFINKMKKLTDKSNDAFVHYEEKNETGKKSIDIDIIGDDDNKIREIAYSSAKIIGGINSIRDVVLRFKEGRPSLVWNLDREKSLQSNVNIVKAGEELRWSIYGPVALKYIKDNKEMDLRVSFSKIFKENLNSFKNYYVLNNNNEKINILDFGTFKEVVESEKIYRKNKRKTVTISAFFNSISLDNAYRLINDKLSNVKLPDKYYFDFGDTIEKYKESQQSSIFTLFLSLFIIFVILTIQFNNMKIPLKIMLIIPVCYSFIFFVFGMLMLRINLPVIIGLVLLAGSVVNNGIILTAKLEGKLTLLKMFKAIRKRLKSIYITTLCTIIAFIPMIFQYGDGSELWRPLSLTLFLGFFSGFLLNILFLPLLLIQKKK